MSDVEPQTTSPPIPAADQRSGPADQRPGAAAPRPDAPLVDPRIGSTVQGEYHIERHLGQDELGPIYEAHNPRRKGRYAVLFLRKDLSPPLKTMVAVRNDLRRTREFAELGLLPTEQLADERGDPCFATERLSGDSLAERLSDGPLSPGAAVGLCAVLGRILSALHAAGLVHGRLRPEHVLLVPPETKGHYAGRAMLFGHGLHHLVRAPGAGADPAWQWGWPPEQLASKTPRADVRGDVYALGMLLYHCLSGSPAGGSAADDAPSPLRLVATEDLPAGLVHPLNVVLAAACAPDPAARIAEIDEFLRALRQVARGAGLPWPGEDAATSKRQSSIVRRLSGIFARPIALSSADLHTDETVLPGGPAPADASGASAPPGEGMTSAATAPPLPRGAVPQPPRPRRGTLERPTVQLAQVREREATLIFRRDATMRLVRPEDISDLVQQVQDGQLDPDTAAHRAQFGEAVGLRGLLTNPMVAALLGGVVVLILLLIARC